jgi:hypothetical protein
MEVAREQFRSLAIDNADEFNNWFSNLLTEDQVILLLNQKHDSSLTLIECILNHKTFGKNAIEVLLAAIKSCISEKNYIHFSKFISFLGKIEHVSADLFNSLQEIFESASEECKIIMIQHFPVIFRESFQEKLVRLLREQLLATSQASKHLTANIFVAFRAINVEYFEFIHFYDFLSMLNGSSLDQTAIAVISFIFSIIRNASEFKLFYLLLRTVQLEKSSSEAKSITVGLLVDFISENPEYFSFNDFTSDFGIFDAICGLVVMGLQSSNKTTSYDQKLEPFLEPVFQLYERILLEKAPSLPLVLMKVGANCKIEVIFQVLFSSNNEKIRIETIDSLLSQLGSKNAQKIDFSLQVLKSLTRLGLRDYLSYLKVSIDSIGDFSLKHIEEFFDFLTHLFLDKLAMDPFVSELVIMFKKQLNCKNAKFQQIGMIGIFCLVKKYFSCSFERNFDTPCASQALTQSFFSGTTSLLDLNQKFCFSLLKTIVETAKYNAEVMKALLQGLLESLNLFPDEIMDYFEEDLIEFLKEKFLFDLQQEEQPRGYTEMFDLSNKKSPVAILISDEYSQVLSAFVEFVKEIEILRRGNLEQINALIEASILVNDSFPQRYKYLQSYLASLANNFALISEFEEKAFERFKQVYSLQGNCSTIESSSVYLLKSGQNLEFVSEWLSFVGKAQVNSQKKKTSYFYLLNASEEKKLVFKSQVLMKFLSRHSNFDALTLFMLENLTSPESIDLFVKLFINLSPLIAEPDNHLSLLDEIAELLLKIFIQNISLISPEQRELLLEATKAAICGKQAIELLLCLECKPESLRITIEQVIQRGKATNFTLYSHLLKTISQTDAFLPKIQEFMAQVKGEDSQSEQIIAGIFEFVNQGKKFTFSTDEIEEKTKTWQILMETIKSSTRNPKILLFTIKHSKKFIDLYNRYFIHQIEQDFSDDHLFYLQLLRSLQTGTRILHNIATHIKENMKESISLIPPLKKSLETLLLRVKNLLKSNGHINAFWLGNLKQKTLDGHTVHSQPVVQ